MLLTIDVGNTQTVVGVYQDDDLRFRWRIATGRQHTADEVRILLNSLLVSEDITGSQIKGCVLASVVPSLTLAWCEAAQRVTGVEVLVCSAETASQRGIFQTDYPNPSEIGADRVADAIAAKAQYGAPVVVVDFGTATNIEVIDNQGCFIGGVIAPGMETSASALFSHATKLGAIDLVEPGTSIGRNTEQAIQAGIVYGEACRVDGLVKRIFAQLGYQAPVVATGGLAARVAEHSETITAVDVDLTLHGLRMVYRAQA